MNEFNLIIKYLIRVFLKIKKELKKKRSMNLYINKVNRILFEMKRFLFEENSNIFIHINKLYFLKTF